MQCDISGKDVPQTIRVEIEGVIMNVAPEYKHLGKEVNPPPVKVHSSTRSRIVKTEQPEKVLVDGYGKLVSQARQKKGWTQSELANKTNEKLSLIQHVETETMHPSEQVAQKLHSTLGVVLFETYEGDFEQERFESKPLTLGDMLQQAKK